MPTRTYKILVEGCIDKAVAKWLARKARLRLTGDGVTISSNGKIGVIRQAIALSLQVSVKSGILGVVDADNSADDTLVYIEKELSRRSLRYRRNVLYENPLLLEYLVDAGSGEPRSLYMLVICRPDKGCEKGAVEDLLYAMLGEAYGCPSEIGYECEGICKCKHFREKLWKLFIPPLMAACVCKYTVTPVGDDRCAIPLYSALDALGLAKTRAANRYIEALRRLP